MENYIRELANRGLSLEEIYLKVKNTYENEVARKEKEKQEEMKKVSILARKRENLVNVAFDYFVTLFKVQDNSFNEESIDEKTEMQVKKDILEALIESEKNTKEIFNLIFNGI